MASIRALYVHIPFCHSICPFCAFAIHQHRPALVGRYLAALHREIREVSLVWHGQTAIESIYVGGGTPSTLPPAEVDTLLALLREVFPAHPDVEIALEVNPEDATSGYLEALLAAGINRISLGIQSLDEATLRALGRGHSAAQSVAALDAARQAGAANFNADLMFGAPGMLPDAFQRDVEALVERRPAHISLYGLDVEDRTRFGRDPVVRAWAAEHRDEQSELYLWAHQRLSSAGYRHYEVSNFAQPGREGRQNLLVWSGAGYLGFGTGAHSFAGTERWHNARHLTAYQREVEAGRPPEAFREVLTPAQRANEYLMLALRRDEGLDSAEWERRFAMTWGERRARAAERLAAAGHARWENRRLTLTPRGFLLADAITEQMMADPG